MKKEQFARSLVSLNITGSDTLSIRNLRIHVLNLCQNLKDIDPSSCYYTEVIDYRRLYDEPAYRVKIVKGTGKYVLCRVRTPLLLPFFPFFSLVTHAIFVPEVIEILVVTLGELVIKERALPISLNVEGVTIDYFDEEAFAKRRGS